MVGQRSAEDLNPDAVAVLEFWFGTLDTDGLAHPEVSSRWFKKSAEFDAEIRNRFSQAYERVARDGARVWGDSPRAVLAAVIVLDQFSRNMFRNASQMYEADPIALELVHAALDAGALEHLIGHERVFLIMPLMHSERLSDQERCVELFTELAGSAPSERVRVALSQNVDYAQKHRDIVAQFGRFPHRNAILGRTNTADESQFLTQPGSSF